MSYAGGGVTVKKSNVRKGTVIMLYSVRGKLIYTTSSCAVVECGGVGYNCQTTINTLKTLRPNTEVKLYTYLNVRDDAIELFGFATKLELETFKTLITVSGVGPKAGLSMLSQLSPEQIAMAIATEDVNTITAAQGIGKKTALRIILELKDKLTKAVESNNFAASAINTAAKAAAGNIAKAVEALGVLGYLPAEVTPVLSQLDGSLPVEQLIAMTLKQMGRND